MFLRSVRNSDRGFSLAEIIIAITILGLAGAALLNGIVTNSKIDRKANDKANAYSAIAAGAEAIASATFVTCNENISNPYSNVALPAGVSVSSVSGLVIEGAAAGTWKSCGPSWPSSQKSALVQKITLSGPLGTSRSVTKTFAGTAAQYGSQGNFKVVPMSSVELIAGAAATNLTLNVSGIPAASDSLIFYVVAGSATVVNPTVNVSGTTWTLSVQAPASTVGHTTVEIGAFDVTASVYAIPTTLSISMILPPPPLILTGVGSASTNPVVGVAGCALKASPFALTASGGNGGAISFGLGSSPPTGFSLTSAGGLSWTTGTCGTTAPAAGSYTVPVNLTGGGYSTAQPVSAYVKLRGILAGTISTSGTKCGAFATSTSTNFCTLTFTSTAGTGSTATISAPTATSISQTVNVAGTPSATYSSTTDQYTITIQIYNKGSGGSYLCKSVTSGTSVSPTLTIADPGVLTASYSITPSFSVTC